MKVWHQNNSLTVCKSNSILMAGLIIFFRAIGSKDLIATDFNPLIINQMKMSAIGTAHIF